MSQTVGVIGLGLMGSAVCPHLIEAGFEVVGLDIDPAKQDAMGAIGVAPAESPRDIAERADIVIMLLPTADALRQVSEGPESIGDGTRTEVIVIDSSTLLLEDKERARVALADKGIELLDCPVSGTRSQVVEKDVVVFASGPDDAVARCQPVFDAFSRATKRLGAFGNATRMKLVHNLLTQVHIAAAAEAFTLGMKSGLDPETILDAISDSAASSRMFLLRGPKMAAQDYDEANAKIEVRVKDAHVIGAFAGSLNCPLPVFAASTQAFEAAMADGRGQQDTASVCAVVEKWAGVRRDGG